jgi:Ca2+-dependent lipid-binding protein
MLMIYVTGLAGWARIPIPIWVEISGVVATARLRVQMVEQMPFVRNCTITLMGTPYVDVSAIPLSRALPNVLDLPLISGFVQSSIAAVCQMYTAPKSITMNLAQLLLGDGTKKDTTAVGVLMVTVHHATELASADSNGKSDPYVVAAWHKFGKPLYSTRVMVSDLNPVINPFFSHPLCSILLVQCRCGRRPFSYPSQWMK